MKQYEHDYRDPWTNLTLPVLHFKVVIGTDTYRLATYTTTSH